jgi:hypothetical protein
MVADIYGELKPMSQFVLDRMLRAVPRLPDGTVRVTASKYIEGKPVGPFLYYGTRSDDPNDVILHEHRRELRGLRLFAAWTNHDDTRAQNTQDSWIEDNGQHYIRHYLMDFGSTFGSGSVYMQLAYLGFSYSLDFSDMKHLAPGFGLRVPTYRTVTWPRFPDYKAVGRWESEYFDPQTWKNDYPNSAFVRMTPRDAFWASKLLMKFTPEQLMSIVETGDFSRPEDVEYFHKVLVARQRKTGEFGINGISPLDEFRLENNALVFTNLSEFYGFSEAGSTEYVIYWYGYDNLKKQRAFHIRGPDRETSPQSRWQLSRQYLEQPNIFMMAEIYAENDQFPHWNHAVRVYLRPAGNTYEVVGIERDTPARPIPME